MFFFFFFKQKTAYEMRISDWSSDVCSSDLQYPELALHEPVHQPRHGLVQPGGAGRDVRAKLLHRPAEPLDVHQEDAQQREASDRIQRKDAPRRVDRRERRGVSAHRVASPCDVVGRQCSWPPSPWTWP